MIECDQCNGTGQLKGGQRCPCREEDDEAGTRRERMGIVKKPRAIKIWVIYRRPSDFPNANFVMREHHIRRVDGANAVTPTEHFYTADSIEQLRQRIPSGKQLMLRNERDEPQIVEWWF
jgi:hypothetical protein